MTITPKFKPGDQVYYRDASGSVSKTKVSSIEAKFHKQDEPVRLLYVLESGEAVTEFELSRTSFKARHRSRLVAELENAVPEVRKENGTVVYRVNSFRTFDLCPSDKGWELQPLVFDSDMERLACFFTDSLKWLGYPLLRVKWLNIPNPESNPRDDKGSFRIDKFAPLLPPEPGQTVTANPKVTFTTANSERLAPEKLDVPAVIDLAKQINGMFSAVGLNASIHWVNIPNEDTNPEGKTGYFRLIRTKLESAPEIVVIPS